MRTSSTDPIRVAWLPAPDLASGSSAPGALGLTFAPGKRGSSLSGPGWSRDLAADLDALRDLGVDLLAPLVEDAELVHLGIPNLVQAASDRGMTVVRLPIPDGGVPDLAGARALVGRLLAHVRGGGRAVVHCRGGLGRAGTVAACCLVAVGRTPADAIAAVRSVRPGALETPGQERFVAAFSP
jgi:ADP-ribosyl-[dinitrogen reductase] hydrolase